MISSSVKNVFSTELDEGVLEILEHVIECQRWFKVTATPKMEFFVKLVDG